MKNLFLAFALFSFSVLAGCSKSEKSEKSETTTTESTTRTERPAHGEPGHNHETDHQNVALYSCPMHPEVTSDQPGTCPKCGMDLVKTETDANEE